jgi:hypothetical protein
MRCGWLCISVREMDIYRSHEMVVDPNPMQVTWAFHSGREQMVSNGVPSWPLLLEDNHETHQASVACTEGQRSAQQPVRAALTGNLQRR